MTNKRLRILISNDDGYDATGIRALADGLREVADIHVVAPLANQSGASSSMSLDDTITISKSEPDVTVVHGTPADCVQLALHGPDILPWEPDLTVSGINMGGNLGDDTLYSGTVAAAAESVQSGVPAIAFSLACVPPEKFPPSNYKAAAKIARDLVLQLQDCLLASKGMMLNVNVPDFPLEQIKSPIVCNLGRRHPGRPISELDSDPSDTMRKMSFGHNHSQSEEGPQSDFEVIESSHVSITPLQFNLTDTENMEKVEQWLAQKAK